MADKEQLRILSQGVKTWNEWRLEAGNAWRKQHGEFEFELRADLSGADLHGIDLGEANLFRADLGKADLHEANLIRADLSEANLREADLERADLRGANLSRAHLSEANLVRADLRGAHLDRANLSWAHLIEAHLDRADLSWATLIRADLRGAHLDRADLRGSNLSMAQLSEADLHEVNLSGADLSGGHLERASLSGANLLETDLLGANLTDADLSGADLTGCRVYGVSAWGLTLSASTKQQGLIITRDQEPVITTDDIEVAQFLYLLIHNEKLRKVIDTITSKVVLILGRFSAERKAVLDALREELRWRNYLPILFDFDVPATRDIAETVSILARMARFIIADLTDPSSIPKELEAIVPSLAVPVQPLLEGSARPYAMFKDYWKYDWVLPVYRYEGLDPLLKTLAEKVIDPAEAKVRALEERRRAIEAELTAPRTSPNY